MECLLSVFCYLFFWTAIRSEIDVAGTIKKWDNASTETSISPRWIMIFSRWTFSRPIKWATSIISFRFVYLSSSFSYRIASGESVLSRRQTMKTMCAGARNKNMKITMTASRDDFSFVFVSTIAAWVNFDAQTTLVCKQWKHRRRCNAA